MSLLIEIRSYIVRHPVLGTVQSALQFTPGRPVHSNAILTLCEAFNHVAINARRLFVRRSTSVCSHVLIYTAE